MLSQSQKEPKKSGIIGIGKSIGNKLGTFFNKKQKPQNIPPPNHKESTTPITSSFSVTPSSSSTSLSSPSLNPPTQDQQTQKQVFNIQLSEDDKDIYKVADDDEEEEEEEEYEEEKTTKAEKTKEEQNSKKENTIEVKGDNKQIIRLENKITPINVKVENKEDKSEEKIKKPNLINPLLFCHRIRKKGSTVDLNDVEYYFIIKKKQRKGLISKLKINAINKISRNYILFFEEEFFYFCKNIQIDQSNSNLRSVGNRYSFLQVSNISLEDTNDNKVLIIIVLIKDGTNSHFNKTFLIDKTQSRKFLLSVQEHFKILNLETASQISN